MVKTAKGKAQVSKAIESVDLLDERAKLLNNLANHKIVDLYVELLAKCDEDVGIFEHYLKLAVHHFFSLLFELKILSNGRLHGHREEIRYAEYMLPGDVRGSFVGQGFQGHDNDRQCRMSELSCDGIQFGVLRKGYGNIQTRVIGIAAEIEIYITDCRNSLSRFMYLLFAERKKANPSTKFTSKDILLNFADMEGADPNFVYRNGVNKHVGVRIGRFDCSAYAENLCDHLLFQRHVEQYVIPPPADPLGHIKHDAITTEFKAVLAEEIAAKKASDADRRAKKIALEAEIQARDTARKARAALKKQQEKELNAKAKVKAAAPKTSAQTATDKKAAANAYAATGGGDDSDEGQEGQDDDDAEEEDDDDDIFSGAPTSGSALDRSLDDVSHEPMAKEPAGRRSEKEFVVADDYISSDEEMDDGRVNGRKRKKAVTVKAKVADKAPSATPTTEAAAGDGKKRKKRDSNMSFDYVQALARMSSSAAGELGQDHPAVEAMTELERAAALEGLVLNFSLDLVRHITVLLVESTVFEQKFTQFYLDQRYYLRPAADDGLDVAILEALDAVMKSGIKQMNELCKLIKQKMDADSAARLASNPSAEGLHAYEKEEAENVTSFEAFKRAMRDKYRNICRVTCNKMVRHWDLLNQNDSKLALRAPPQKAKFETRFALEFGGHGVTAGKVVNQHIDFVASVGDVAPGQESIPTTVCALLDMLNKTHPIATGLGMALLAKVSKKVKSNEHLPGSAKDVQSLLTSRPDETILAISAPSAAATSSVPLLLPRDLVVPTGTESAASSSNAAPVSQSVDVASSDSAEVMHRSLLCVRLQKLAGYVFADASSSNDTLALCMHLRRQTLRSEAIIKMLAFVLKAMASGSVDTAGLVQEFLSSEHSKVMECAFLVPFSESDRGNTGANGYCFPRSQGQAKRRALSGFKMSFADVIKTDEELYDLTDEDARTRRVELYKDLLELKRKLHHLNDISGVDMSDDVRRIDGMVYCYRIKANDSLYEEFWGKLDWLSLMGGNVSGFSHTTSYPGLPSDKLWARLWNSTLIRQEQPIHDAGGVTTVAEIGKIVSIPANYIVFHVNHFFVIDSPVIVEAPFKTALAGIFSMIVSRAQCFPDLDKLVQLVDSYMSKADSVTSLMQEEAVDVFLKQCLLAQEVRHAQEQNAADEHEKSRAGTAVLLGGLEEATYERTVIAPLSAQEKVLKIKELQKKTDTLVRKNKELEQKVAQLNKEIISQQSRDLSTASESLMQQSPLNKSFSSCASDVTTTSGDSSSTISASHEGYTSALLHMSPAVSVDLSDD